MSTAAQFDNRRRERQHRERLRKKRIRAAILLVALIGIIVLICVAIYIINSGNNNDNSKKNLQNIVEQINLEQETPASSETPAPSGASGIPAPSDENDLLKIITNSGQTKRCYLTFDDGPTTNITPQILDVLRRYNIKATFFEVGSLIESNSDMARRVYEEGHLIANHSDGHNYEKLYASTDSFINEIEKCYDTIKNVTDGEEPFRLVRFPGGSYKSNADSFSPVKQECKKALKEHSFYYSDWNALNGDAEGKKKNAQELLEYLKRNMDKDGGNIVVLMHDAAAKQATADALPSIIEYLLSEGYTFHRMDDIDFQGNIIPATASPDTVSTSPSSSSAQAPQPTASSAPTQRPAMPTVNPGAPIIIN